MAATNKVPAIHLQLGDTFRFDGAPVFVVSLELIGDDVQINGGLDLSKRTIVHVIRRTP